MLLFLFRKMIRAQSTFLLLLLFTSGTFAEVFPRARSCCGFMNGKIYCYGGDIYSTTTQHKPDNGMNVLDLTRKSGTLATDLQTMWQPVSYNINNVDFSSREDPQCVILENGYQMLVNGGYNATRPGQIANLNIAFNINKNQWDALPEYTEPPYGRRQIYHGTAITIPGQGVAFYGGLEQHINASWTMPSLGNVSMFTFGDPPTSRAIGYSQIAMFQPNSQTAPWKTLVPIQGGPLANEISSGDISVFDPMSNEIIFFGGRYLKNNPPDGNYIPRPFDVISVVNVNNSHWRRLNPQGDVPPPDRVYATATLLPSTNRHVLLFGGETQSGEVCSEYCFTLNLDTNTWKKHAVAAPSVTALQRSRHSAVLVNNDTLFIMWGMDANNVGISSILVLNVSNPESIVLSRKYIDPSAPNASQDVIGNTETNDDGSSIGTMPGGSGSNDISTGAKAGIAVACIVVAILGFLSIWFCLRNRKNKETIRNQQRELAVQQQYQEEHEDAIPMEVDWDRIENKYSEMPSVYTLSNPVNRIDDDHRMGSPTTFNAETLVNATEPASLHVVLPDGVESQNPHALEPGSNDVQSSLNPMNRTIKPDGFVRSSS